MAKQRVILKYVQHLVLNIFLRLQKACLQQEMQAIPNACMLKFVDFRPRFALFLLHMHMITFRFPYQKYLYKVFVKNQGCIEQILPTETDLIGY